MPRKTGSRTGARSAASSAETRTWLFRWFQRARRERAPHPITSWQTPLCPLPASGARARAAPTGADGLRNNNLGKTTIARRGRAKRRHWREANADRAQNKGGRPGAARRSGPARFDFATNDAGAAARRAPSEWLRRLNKPPPPLRARKGGTTWLPSFLPLV